jgi:hypothetical protein
MSDTIIDMLLFAKNCRIDRIHDGVKYGIYSFGSSSK